MPVAIFFVIP